MDISTINSISSSRVAADLLRTVSINARDREIFEIISEAIQNPSTARARDLFYFCAGILTQQHIRQARYHVAIRRAS